MGKQGDYGLMDDGQGSEDELYLFFTISARMIIKLADDAAFLDWIADAGPHLAPAIAAAIDPHSGEAGPAFRIIGVEILNITPRPDAGFRCRPFKKPGRNVSCHCGSGRKYKHCCLSLEGALDLGDYNMLPHVLDALPKKIYTTLPDTAVTPDMIADTACQWQEQGDAKRAISLLEPWFAPGQRLTVRLEPLFDQLMDGYLELGNERKRQRLVEGVIDRGDRGLRAVALQRRAMMLADRGDDGAAWEAFQAAQRESPDNPSLAILEVTLLFQRGDMEQTRERARFWLLRLERAHNPEFADLVDLMRAISIDPMAALAGLGQGMHADLARLEHLFATAPVAEAHYRIRTDGGDDGVLVPDRRLADIESAWDSLFPGVKPGLTMVNHGNPEVWDDAPAWLEYLEHKPLAWQSFNILDDLAMAVDALRVPGTDVTLLDPMLDRGCMLLAQNLAGAENPDVELPWGYLDNRPALRLLAHRIFRMLDAEQEAPDQTFIELAERLLALNPHDNHGIRTDLARAYLVHKEPDKALALSDRFPDDFCGLMLNRILALYRLGRTEEAQQVLLAVADEHVVAIKMLLAANPKQPPVSDFGVSPGGKDEAWLYRVDHLALWKQDDALGWLRSAWRKINRKT